MSEKILRFYRTLRTAVGFGEVWMRLDDDGSVLIEWYPTWSETSGRLALLRAAGPRAFDRIEPVRR